MSDKFYHNDYKKLLGVDQSRTASEKLLDRAMTNRNKGQPSSTLTPHLEDIPERPPVKKVKLQSSQQSQLSPETVFKRVFHSLDKQRDCFKISKAVSVINKCVSNHNFIEQMTMTQVNQLLQKLLMIDAAATGSATEIFKLISQVRETVIIISQHPMLLRQAHNTLKKQEDSSEQLCFSQEELNLKSQFYRLYTDDSFQFHDCVRIIKSKVFQVYGSAREHQNAVQKEQTERQPIDSIQAVSQTQAVQPKKTLTTQFIEQQILGKIIGLPRIDTYAWIKTTITSFISEFLKEYKDLLHEPREFLLRYNRMLAVNPGALKGSLGQSKEMMPRSAGGTFTVVEQQDSASAWCKRQ